MYHIWKLYFLFGHLLHKMEFRQEFILGSTGTLLNETHIQHSCLYWLTRKKGTWTTEGSFYSSSHNLVVNASCPLEMLKSYHKQFSAMVPAFVAWDPKAPSLTTFYSVPAHSHLTELPLTSFPVNLLHPYLPSWMSWPWTQCLSYYAWAVFTLHNFWHQTSVSPPDTN